VQHAKRDVEMLCFTEQLAAEGSANEEINPINQSTNQPFHHLTGDGLAPFQGVTDDGEINLQMS
jgi:hypothetical protein